MRTAYCVKNEDTGEYWCVDQWAEEPEWFPTWDAADRCARRVGKNLNHPLGIESHEMEEE